MTRRPVGVLALPAPFPTGELRAAMVEDVYETVAGLALVEPVLVLAAGDPAAPRRSAVSVGPGWHRVRAVHDLDVLDRGLEGWEVTRAVLSR